MYDYLLQRPNGSAYHSRNGQKYPGRGTLENSKVSLPQTLVGLPWLIRTVRRLTMTGGLPILYLSKF